MNKIIYVTIFFYVITLFGILILILIYNKDNNHKHIYKKKRKKQTQKKPTRKVKGVKTIPYENIVNKDIEEKKDWWNE